MVLQILNRSRVYYVFIGYLFSTDAIGAMEKYAKELVHSVMERAEAVYQHSGVKMNVEKKVGTGDAKDVICHTVEKLRADTLVMGSHGYGFFKRLPINYSLSYEFYKV
uniref:UspA domain-containing protein n=1 Tax=Cannabis sativa TaxID=3483 RepID=A0A803NPM9_CANSA